jgi:hypothetical protein
MRTFNEYYESKRLVEVDNWITKLADLFLSKYGPKNYTAGINPKAQPSPNIDFGRPSQTSPSGWEPNQKPIRANTGVGGALHPYDKGYDAVDPDQEDQQSAAIRGLGAQWSNSDPNEELKKMAYQKIKEMLDDPAQPIRHPKEIMARLRQDPEMNSYLDRVTYQQRGAFQRHANVGWRQQADQWHNPLQPHPGMDPGASAQSMLSMPGGRV